MTTMPTRPVTEDVNENLQSTKGSIKRYFPNHKAIGQASSLLLARGEDVNAADEYGDPPLLVVSECACQLEIAHLLIMYGARLEVGDCEGKTILHIALRRRNWKMARYVAWRDSSLATAVDIHANLPVHFVSTKMDLKVLIRAGLRNLDVTNDFGATPLSPY